MTALVRSIALCLGGAQSVWDELRAAKAIVGDHPHVIVACNFAGIQYEGHLDAWATLHPERFSLWMEARAAAGRNTDYRAFTHKTRRGLPTDALPYRWYGSSGLYMAQVALEQLECPGAILCGVPMNGQGGHIHWAGDWQSPDDYCNGFVRARDAGAQIRSMSGWTRDLFGPPDLTWLNSVAERHDQRVTA